jgi:hypothetical protein
MKASCHRRHTDMNWEMQDNIYGTSRGLSPMPFIWFPSLCPCPWSYGTSRGLALVRTIGWSTVICIIAHSTGRFIFLRGPPTDRQNVNVISVETFTYWNWNYINNQSSADVRTDSTANIASSPYTSLHISRVARKNYSILAHGALLSRQPSPETQSYTGISTLLLLGAIPPGSVSPRTCAVGRRVAAPAIRTLTRDSVFPYDVRVTAHLIKGLHLDAK